MAALAVTAASQAGISSPAEASAPRPGHLRPVAVHAVRSHYAVPKPQPSWAARPTHWPSGRRTAVLDGSARARAGSLPVWVAAGRTRSGAAAPAPSSVEIEVAGRAVAAAAGVQGVLLSARPAGSGDTQITLGYDEFRDAFGGEWASRLRLVRLPACALTTPEVTGCRTQTPVASSNDTATGTLRANVPMAATGGAMVLAAVSSGSGGGGGDFTATSLQASGSWSAGGSTDEFSWSYPIPVPDVPGGLKPSVSLGYSSQAVDGLTSSTNNQPSLMGDGWDYSPGFIERSYQSCHENPAGATRTWDNCWTGKNTLSLSLNGSSSALVRDDATGTYHPENDRNEKIEHLTGADNGDRDGEYWRITTADGVQYYFGQHKLPGWSEKKAVTNSVWTEPVFFTASGSCYNSTWANSWCQKAYRWNLDYVVDPHGDAIAYYYGAETNFYARNLGSTGTAGYVRGGYLSRIDYGLRDGAAYSSTPAGQVSFSVNGRCKTASGGCAVSTLNSTTAPNWPDVPFDLNCASGAACSVQSPSFWSEYELTGIQTKALVGTTLTNVDAWTFNHSFPATGDNTQPALWLSSITRTGQDTTGGGSTAPITLPPVTFVGIPLSNRSVLTNGYSPITRQRMYTITTETGGTVTVNYSAPACATPPTDPATNTKLCFPAYWTPTGEVNPRLDWFNKFVVTGVTQDDATGGSANDTIATTYTPVGTPAWHYDTSPLTPANKRTWNQFRGFGGLIVSTGTAPDPITKTQYTYFRGMDGDVLPNNGTRSATITDSRDDDPAVRDAEEFAGQTYETRTFNGGDLVSSTVTTPWSSATAGQAVAGLPTLRAYHVGTAQQRSFTPLASGETRTTQVVYRHDGYGRVTSTDDLGDIAIASDDICTRVSFADNVAASMLNKAYRSQQFSVNCSTTPSIPADVVSDTLSFYDSSTTVGAVPSTGDLTMVQRAASYSGSTPAYATISTATPDQYGRTTTATDPLGHLTTTTYVPAAGAEPTTVTVTDPMKLITTTSFDPLRALPLSKTTAAGYVTRGQYDALGRLTAVFKPGQSSSTVPVVKYAYTVASNAPSTVDQLDLNQDLSTYRTSRTLYDSMLRARETQTQTIDGGRTVTDTVYNTNGLVSVKTDPYYTTGSVSNVYVQAQAGQVPSATAFSYDGASRTVNSSAYALGTKTWETTYRYGGNFTTTIPPAGQPPTTTLLDARGRTRHLYQYHAGKAADPINDAPSDYTDTSYEYHPDGKASSLKDAAGNVWSWSYNLLGFLTQAKDPDTGTTLTAYDNAGQLLTSTDARGKQTTYTYDLDGRKTAAYDTSDTQALTTSNRIGAWTYDTVKKGLPASVTSYSAGDTYTNTVLAYDNQGHPSASKTTLTGPDAGLVPSSGYVLSTSWNQTGLPSVVGQPAAGGLTAESVTTGYDNFGHPKALGSTGNSYVQAIGYNELEQPLQLTMSGADPHLYLDLTYDDQTHAVTSTKVTGVSGVIDQTNYSYGDAHVSKGAGLLLRASDAQSESGVTVTDTQCYSYDDAARLQQAWTSKDACASTPAPGQSDGVGGSIAPYWQSWTYNSAGLRATQVDHDVDGVTANDTTSTYNYPVSGASAVRPHTLSGTSASGPKAAAGTAAYTYDESGQTLTATGGGQGDQTYTWNDQGKLASTATSTGTTTYVYDIDGNLIVRREPGKSTLFLGDQEITQDTTTKALSATRYYGIAGYTVAVRTSSDTKISYLVADLNGTSQLSITDVTQAVVRRRYLPFGAKRGGAAGWWPGLKGFVGGQEDQGTGLTNLGAREYNPLTGRFLSADPVLESGNPQSFNAYDYADNNPVTKSDPSGRAASCSGLYGQAATNCNTYASYGDVNGTGHSPADNSSGLQAGKAQSQGSHGSVSTSGNSSESHVQSAEQDQFDADIRHARLTFMRTAQESPLGKAWMASVLDTDRRIKAHQAIARWEYDEWKFWRDGLGVVYEDETTESIIFMAASVGVGGAIRTGATFAARNLIRVAAQAGGEQSAHVLISAQLDSLGSGTPVLCNSFRPETLVLTSAGTWVPIARIKAGDRVLATDPKTGRTTERGVVAVLVQRHRDLYDVRVKAGPVEGVLHTTAGHPFWVDATGAWVRAENLVPGVKLHAVDGRAATVSAVEPLRSVSAMWNLTVAGDHTYYVLAAGTSALVHNSACPAAIALGLSTTDDNPWALADFADRTGATMWTDWPQDRSWESIVKEAVGSESKVQIHFNLDGIDDPAGFAEPMKNVASPDAGDFTAWELQQIRAASSSVQSRVTWYRDGEVAANPFAGG